MAQRTRSPRPTQRVPPRRPVARSPYAPRRRATCGGSLSIWLLLLLSLVGALGYIVYDRTLGAITEITTTDPRVKPERDAPPPPLLQEPFNVLLIGVDAREAAPDEGVRSDTLIVVHVDPIEKWASMLSIPRDSFVSIPFHEEIAGDKITLAYSRGFQDPTIYGPGTEPEEAGQALAADTVEEFLGIRIDYTAQIDHRGFEKLVDAIDGITLDVPHAILDAEYPTEDFGYMRLLIEPGLQRMDGETALRYARTRHADSDFGRSQRQQQVLQAALDELKRRGVLGQIEALPDLLTALEETVLTTLPLDLNTLRGLASLAQEIGTDRIVRYAINPDTVAVAYSDNTSNIYWESAEVKQLAQQFEQGPSQVAAAPETATVQVQNGKGIKGLASQISVDLALEGFTLAEPPATDAPTADNPHTLILDYSDKPQTRARLAEFFGLSPEYVRDESANKENAPFGVDIVVLVGDDYEPQFNSSSQ